MADIKIEPGYTRATPMLSSFAASAHQWPYRVWFYTRAPLVTWCVHDRVYACVCVYVTHHRDVYTGRRGKHYCDIRHIVAPGYQRGK